MNKKTIYAVAAALLLFFSGSNLAQTATIDLQIFEPLPEVDLGSIIIQNNTQGVPKVFLVQINPSGILVFVKGIIYWDKMDGTGFKQLFEFTTNNFASRNFYSDELGNSGITIKTSSSVSSLTDDLIAIGKPKGAFRFSLILYNSAGAQMGQTSKDVTFSNPAQTLSIITPEINSTQSVGSVVANWNSISGVEKYKIKLNVRTSPSQSLEEALDSGTPLIDNKDVSKNLNSIDLRTLLEREWLPGQELVLRVTAITGGIGGGSDLSSNLVNFTIAQPSTPVDNTKNALITLLNQMQNEKATQFIALLSNVAMDGVKFYNNDGNEITFQQFQTIVNSILSSITKITLTNQ